MIPRTVGEYLELLDQAIFETEELIACADDESEGDLVFSRQLAVYEQLAKDLKQFREDILAERHEFGDDTDLPFLAPLRESKAPVPYMPLLAILNEVHRAGF